MISQTNFNTLGMGREICLPIQEKTGSFSVEEEGLLLFATPVLENVDYIPSNLEKYIASTMDNEYLDRLHLFLLFDEDKRVFFLEGVWEFHTLDCTTFNALLRHIEEVAIMVKSQMYQTLCSDLVYVLAGHTKTKK